MSAEAASRGRDNLAVDLRASRGTSSAVMAMVIFVASESMFFMAFLGVYASAYAAQPVWPPAIIPLLSVGIPTAVVATLVLSGVTMLLALRAVRRGTRRASTWLSATIALGVAACVLQVLGYRDLGFSIHSGIFGSLFYLATGVAFAHVVGGLVFLGLVLTQAVTGELALRRDPAVAAAIYWSFVVVLGVVVYVVFFLAVSAAVAPS